ncbi:MAG: alpha/beta hydrolase [Actinobacteria bacterium]|nr:alpha/beta hydrolase [Actinomycetota bacterium]
MTHPPVVPFDAELAPIAGALYEAGKQQSLSRESLPAIRASFFELMPDAGTAIGDRPVDTREVSIPGPLGEIPATLLWPRDRDRTTAAPVLVNYHGGGTVIGNRFFDTERLVALVLEFGFVAVNVEYRLAPDYPHPAPAEDCYAALLWTAEHADELGVDLERLIVMGGSAGGGLAAAVALMARDRRGPEIRGQLLLCPMIDDRNETVATYQYDASGTWTRPSALFAWSSLLGESAGGPDTPPYAAPARAADLSGLPSAFIEVGSAEMFRDECSEYATRIWAAGGAAELHVWSGAFHGFDVYAPQSELAAAALASRSSWFRRVLGLHVTGQTAVPSPWLT